jgi:hypothetical protein
MKKLLNLLILVILGFFILVSSCTKETFTEADAYASQSDLALLQDSIAKSQALLLDSLRKEGGIINYSVAAVDGSNSSWSWANQGNKGAQQLDAVTVTISQYGVIKTVTTDASGIATFKDLRIGTINVNIRKTGYTEVDFVALLPALPDSSTVNAYNVMRSVATMVPVFSTATELSTISGLAKVETDLTNDAPEAAANVKVIATVDISSSDFYDRYIYNPYNGDISYSNYTESYIYDTGTQSYSDGGLTWKFDYYGVIKHIAYHSTVSTATTAADGSFSLSVPSSPDGLPIRVFASEFAANQSILQATLNNAPVWGTQSIRTIFGDDNSSYTYSSIPALGLSSGNVQSAFVQFSAPTGAAAAQPTTVATATAVLASSGIVSINITSPGEGYTQPPLVVIPKGTGFNSIQAEGTAVVNGGKVTGVTITNGGSGYRPDDNTPVTFIESVDKQAFATAEFTFSITGINLNDEGSGYGQTPPAVTILGSGTGATAHAVMAAELSKITITNPGSGYTQAPHMVISDNFYAWDQVSPVMTTNNPLFSITYDGTNPTLWPAAPVPTATIIGTGGAGATANVTLSSTGKVNGFTALIGGSGYTSAPTVTITGGGAGFGATATATILAGSVNGITITDNGQGYTSIPTFTFTGGGGTGASATVVLGFPVQTITLNAAGVGYGNVTAINVDNGSTPVNYIGQCLVKFNMGIRDVNFTPNGWFYKAVPTVTITPLDGNGSGATAVASLNWRIDGIQVDNQGSGYKYDNSNNVTVRIAAPTGIGTQASASADLGKGLLSRVEIDNFGQGYTAPPNVYISGGVLPTRQARLTATVSGGQLTGITITDPGAGYNFGSYIDGDYNIDISTFNSVASASGNANPRSGQIDFIQIDNPGAGYAVVPTVEIVNDQESNPDNGNGFGTGAVATATVVDGRVSAITVSNAGSGYYTAPLVKLTVASSVMKAVAKCIVDPDGRITGVDFSGGYPYTKGFGYNAVPTVTFLPSVTGKGSGAAGVAILNDGQIESVVMTNQGSGYLGKNNPSDMKPVTPGLDLNVLARASKTYIRDIYFGTGKRTIEQ